MMMMKEEDEKKEDTLMLVLFGGQLSRPWIAPKTAGMQSKSSLTRGNGYFNRPSHTVFDDDAQGYSGMHAQINDVWIYEYNPGGEPLEQGDWHIVSTGGCHPGDDGRWVLEIK